MTMNKIKTEGNTNQKKKKCKRQKVKTKGEKEISNKRRIRKKQKLYWTMEQKEVQNDRMK